MSRLVVGPYSYGHPRCGYHGAIRVLALCPLLLWMCGDVYADRLYKQEGMEVAMHGSKPQCVVLPTAARLILEQLERRYVGQQIGLRACIILDAADGRNNSQIARDLNISLDMVRLWRRRWIELDAAHMDEPAILDCLTDAPRSGRPTNPLHEREVAGHQAHCREASLGCC